jgi:hypothetical protein
MSTASCPKVVRPRLTVRPMELKTEKKKQPPARYSCLLTDSVHASLSGPRTGLLECTYICEPSSVDSTVDQLGANRALETRFELSVEELPLTGLYVSKAGIIKCSA